MKLSGAPEDKILLELLHLDAVLYIPLHVDNANDGASLVYASYAKVAFPEPTMPPCAIVCFY